MIDVHAHILPFVDDGSTSVENSLRMIETEIENGVTDVICTPHFRLKMFEKSLDDFHKSFSKIKELVKEKNLPVNLYLGCEFHQTDSLLKKYKDCFPYVLNGSRYVLLEFDALKITDVSETVYNYILCGYNVIIAHVERYGYLTRDDWADLKNMGALFQINASALFASNGYYFKKNASKMLKSGYVDFVASDVHEDRKNFMKAAYNKILRKYGKIVADDLFTNNAQKILRGEKG